MALLFAPISMFLSSIFSGRLSNYCIHTSFPTFLPLPFLLFSNLPCHAPTASFPSSTPTHYLDKENQLNLPARTMCSRTPPRPPPFRISDSTPSFFSSFRSWSFAVFSSLALYPSFAFSSAVILVEHQLVRERDVSVGVDSVDRRRSDRVPEPRFRQPTGRFR